MDFSFDSDSSENCFEVKKVIAKRKKTQGDFYLVKWKDSNNAVRTTWEPLRKFKKYPDLLAEFEVKQNAARNRSQLPIRKRKNSSVTNQMKCQKKKKKNEVVQNWEVIDITSDEDNCLDDFNRPLNNNFNDIGAINDIIEKIINDENVNFDFSFKNTEKKTTVCIH